MKWTIFNSLIAQPGGLKMLSKESKQVIIKQIESDLIRLKDANKSFLIGHSEVAAKIMQKILQLEKALKELQDV